MGGYIVYDKVFAGKNIDPNTQSIETNNQNDNTLNGENKNEVEEPKTYKSYQIGDIVILNDSSKWYVLTSSSESDEYVTLLSAENINKEYRVSFDKASSFISTTYKTNLISDIEKEKLLLNFKKDVAKAISSYKTPQDVYIEAEGKLRKK